jgi:hypothetical protein
MAAGGARTAARAEKADRSVVRATGHYNANCEVFFNGTRAERAEALVFASGYAAALNNF